MHCAQRIRWFDKRAFRNTHDIEKYLAADFDKKQRSDGARWRFKARWFSARLANALLPIPGRVADAKAAAATSRRKIAETASAFFACMSPGAVRSLTHEAAKIVVRLAREDRELKFNRLAALDAKTARALAKHRGPLHLNGITSLNATTAEALSQHAGALHLNGISHLTDDALACIAKAQGPLHMLSLSPTTTAAELLSQRQGETHVSKLLKTMMLAVRALTKSVAESPGHNTASSIKEPGKRKKAPPGPRELAPESAQKLVLLPIGDLTLDEYCKLSPTAARILATRRGVLSLGGLHRLPPLVASELARHVGTLKLNGLEELTAESAEYLASHDGDLELDGLRKLSPDVAWALVEHRHRLSLGGVQSVGSDVAAELRLFRGSELSLFGLVDADPKVVAVLRQNPSIRLPSHLAGQ